MRPILLSCIVAACLSLPAAASRCPPVPVQAVSVLSLHRSALEGFWTCVDRGGTCSGEMRRLKETRTALDASLGDTPHACRNALLDARTRVSGS